CHSAERRLHAAASRLQRLHPLPTFILVLGRGRVRIEVAEQLTARRRKWRWGDRHVRARHSRINSPSNVAEPMIGGGTGSLSSVPCIPLPELSVRRRKYRRPHRDD